MEKAVVGVGRRGTSGGLRVWEGGGGLRGYGVLAWLWDDAVLRRGYGMMRYGGRRVRRCYAIAGAWREGRDTM